MRKWFILVFMVNILLVLTSFFFLPEKVATHFSLGGTPDSWGPKGSYVAILLALEIPLFFILFYIPRTILKFPERMINLPNKEYWLKEENKPRVQTLFTERMSGMGTMFFAFLAAVQLLVIDANLSVPVRLRESLFLPVLVAFILYMLYWTIAFIRAFRVPGGDESRPVQESDK
jgi:uncharacterized membrane protein